MKRTLIILAGLVLLGGVCSAFVATYYLGFSVQRIYAIGSRRVEFTFVILDEDTKQPIRDAIVEIWDDPLRPTDRKKIAQIVTDGDGIAKYVRENQSVEDVTGAGPNEKFEGIRRHPAGMATFVDRYWCTLDISADGYFASRHDSLANYEYDDNGYDAENEIHRFEFSLTLRRKK